MQNNDLLLLAGKIMTYILMGLTLLVSALFVLMIPGLLIFQGEFAQAVADAGGSSVGAALAASITLLALGTVATIGAFYFFRLLANMINSVGAGDPFTIENAKRLSRMGWIALIFQIATFPIGALAIYLGTLVPVDNLTVDFDFSLTGLLLAVVLFILARVFKHGAEMREDLEGTV